MIAQTITLNELRDALAIRDLSDPAQGPHAMQQLIDDALNALRALWGCDILLHRQSPIVSIEDNYDRLHYPADGAAREARYTRYVSEASMLRTQTSASIPGLLRRLAVSAPEDLLLACPGIVYRRDCIDRLHTGEPHQLDLWRIRRGARLTRAELLTMIEAVVQSLLPGRAHRAVASSHPYTLDGLQIDVMEGRQWIEIGECGLALPALLLESGLDTEAHSGLAMGLGLDRILMLRKGLDDIRLLRASDPRISSQLLDLTRYRPVSSMPPVRRDLSLVLPEEATAEELGAQVRGALQERASVIEQVEILSETGCQDLPEKVIARLGMREGQKNVLLRVVLRALDRTLTDEECNQLRDVIYRALHQGPQTEWCAPSIERPE